MERAGTGLPALKRARQGSLRGALALGFFWLAAHAANAQTAESASRNPGAFMIPGFIDPERRLERRDLPRNTTLRFVTEEDFPPFNYVGRDGALSGFNIDLARAICAELNANCTIQPRRWDLLLPAVERGEADAVIAAHRITADLRRQYEVSLPTHRSPARFAARRDRAIASADVRDLQDKAVAVVGGSAHEAFLNAFFPSVRLTRFDRLDQALAAVRSGETDLVFGDGVTIAFWMNGSESLDCCGFVGGPFTEGRYFGEGAGIVMRRGNSDLRSAIDYALWRISRDGRFAKLYLKHFPIPFY